MRSVDRYETVSFCVCNTCRVCAFVGSFLISIFLCALFSCSPKRGHESPVCEDGDSAFVASSSSPSTVVGYDSVQFVQDLVDFLYPLMRMDSTYAADSYRRRYLATPDSLKPQMVTLTHDYLFNPESPIYSQALYTVVLDALHAEGAVDDELFRLRHADLMKNRVGSRATDFDIITREGKRTTLGNLAADDSFSGQPLERVILFFYDPDCNVCADVEKRLVADERLNAQIAAGRVKFIAVDPGDTPVMEWEAHAKTLPENWIVGRSPGGRVDNDDLYVIRATPTVYILTPDLIVVGQDVNL